MTLVHASKVIDEKFLPQDTTGDAQGIAPWEMLARVTSGRRVWH